MSAEAAFELLTDLLRSTQSPDADFRKPVFWLGAGCSVADGIPLGGELIEEVLLKSSQVWGSPQYRFDRLLEGHLPEYRQKVLTPLLDGKLGPASPYNQLASMVEAGYVDVVVTFNIDGLVVDSMLDAGQVPGRDFDYLIGPELRTEALLARLGDEARRVKIFAIHGDKASGISLMTSGEVVEYGEKRRDVVRALSERPAVVCGYSFLHLNMLSAFSQVARPMFFVNPQFPDNPAVLSLMSVRNGRNANFIDGDLGRWDEIMRRMTAVL